MYCSFTLEHMAHQLRGLFRAYRTIDDSPLFTILDIAITFFLFSVLAFSFVTAGDIALL